MGSDRITLRGLIGEGLPRGYYDKSTLTALSTTRQLIDSKRSEDRDYWNGASCKVGSDEVQVRGGSGEGRLFLDRALSSAPASGTSYEIIKGWTINDFNKAIDQTLERAFPWLYTPIDDSTTNTETTGTTTITLPATWREIKYVRRQIENSSPTRWTTLIAGVDYTIRMGSTGALVFEMLYDPKTGIKLHFVGEAIMTMASGDTATAPAADPLIVEGALWRLYRKGIQPDEPALSASFEGKAAQHEADFKAVRSQFAMYRETSEVRRPHLVVRNDGTRVPYD